MFSVVFWILCSRLPCLADWQVSCSRYVVQLQQNICHQNDCEHEWQHTFFPKRTWGSEQNFLRRDEYRQPDTVGTLLDSTWYTKLAILNSARRITGSQWGDKLSYKLEGHSVGKRMYCIPPTEVFRRDDGSLAAVANTVRIPYVGFSQREVPRTSTFTIAEKAIRFLHTDYNPDRDQKLISSSRSRRLSTRNISSKSMHAFFE